jgi:hypothetical protein
MLFVNMAFFNEKEYYCQNTETNFFWVVQQSIYWSDCWHHPEACTGDGLLKQLKPLQKETWKLVPS